jgi:septum formation protein
MIVLASRSPRRRQLLDMLGVAHVVDPADIVERAEPGELPETLAVRLAREKALVVAARRPGDWVLAADTVVVLGDEMLGKPDGPDSAKRMLARLAGKEHRVITAVALARDAEIHERCDVTRVWFRELDTESIDAYVATGEPLDKAGAYGLQGYGSVLVRRIDGDCFGVIGMPVRLVVDLLGVAGMPYRFTR